MKISIVTPSYNQGQFLEQTIDSVLTQNYPDLEYIIIDGGSTDNSVEIIKKYQKHLHYWISEPDSGQSEAINKGLQQASGDVFNWLNSDDYYAPGTLKMVGEAFSNPDVKVLAARSCIFSDNGSKRLSRGTDLFTGNLAKTIGWARIDQPETFFRKQCIDNIGGVNPELHYIMDRDLWIRYLLHHGSDGIKRSDEVLVNFRIHKTSKTGQQVAAFNQERNNYFYTLAELTGLEKYSNILETVQRCQNLPIKPIGDHAILKSALEYFLVLLGEEFYRLNQRQKAQRIFEIIDANDLDRETATLLRKLRFRNQYLPLWLVRMLRQRS